MLTIRKNTAVPAPAEIPGPRTITSRIMRPRESLSAKDTEKPDQVRLACPDITHACNLARAFADLVRQRRGTMLPQWISQAETSDFPALRSFAGSLRQDFDAMKAGLTLSWSSGIVGGHVNRVTTIKRAMYGQASLELLRTRILTT